MGLTIVGNPQDGAELIEKLEAHLPHRNPLVGDSMKGVAYTSLLAPGEVLSILESESY